MNRQYIRPGSDLPGVEAFDEEPLEIPFVGSTKHREAIDSCVVEVTALVSDCKSLKPALL
jgi:hypothetical protein